MSLQEDFGQTPIEIKKAANDNVHELSPVALEAPILEAAADSIKAVGVDLENNRIERDNTNKRDELVGQLAYQGIEKELGPELAAADDAQSPEPQPPVAAAAGGTPQPPVDPSVANTAPIIPPQTRDYAPPVIPTVPPQTEPMAPYLHPTKQPGFAMEKNMADTTKEFTNKVSEWLPHSPFGRFASRAERAGVRIFNAPQEAFYGVMYRWRSEHATAAEMDYKKYGQEIKSKNTALSQADAGRAATIEQQRAAGLPTTDIAIKLEGERAKALKGIEKIQKQHDRAGKQLEDLNARKSGWAKKENDLAERTIAKIDQRIAPDKGAFDALVVKKAEVAEKLAMLGRARDMGHQGLQELQAKLKLDPNLINNVAIPDKIKAVKELLEKIDNEFNESTSASNRIDNKMRKANNFISGWSNFANEQARVTTQDRRTFNPGDQNIEDTSAHEAPNLTHAPEPKISERGHTIPVQEKAAASAVTANIEGTIESKESIKEATPEAYIGQWNKLFGKNEANFDLKVFTEYTKLKPKEAVSVEKIERALSEILTKGVTGAAVIYAKEGIKARCEKVRQALQQQGNASK